MINQASLVGRLVDNPEIRFTNTGKAVSSFKIASARPYKDQSGNKPTDFISCTVWGPQAEFIANNGKKGAFVGVSGRMESRSYDHAQYPIKVYITELNCDEVQLLNWDDSSQGSTGGSQGGYNQNNQNNSQGNRNNSGGGSQGGYNQNNNQGNWNQQQNNNQGGGYNRSGNTQQNNGGYGNQGGYNRNNDPFANDGKPIDISDDDLPF